MSLQWDNSRQIFQNDGVAVTLKFSVKLVKLIYLVWNFIHNIWTLFAAPLNILVFWNSKPNNAENV